jgi:uncharacterized protein YuzE
MKITYDREVDILQITLKEGAIAASSNVSFSWREASMMGQAILAFGNV